MSRFEWISTVGIVVNTIIAICAIWLLYIANSEQRSWRKGIKNLSGSIAFYKDHPIYGKSGFMIAIQNTGETPQNIAFIQNDKKEHIHLFINHKNKPHFILKPKEPVVFFLDIKKTGMLMKLEKADSLILFNNMGETNKIIKKRAIQRALELYKSSQ